jgi:hypothetical protein
VYLAGAKEMKPIAWLEPEWGEEVCLEIGYQITITSDHPKDLCWIPLYTTPKTKEWQYLTDDEIKEIIGGYGSEGSIGAYTRSLIDKIEAKIRDKNEREPKENN